MSDDRLQRAERRIRGVIGAATTTTSPDDTGDVQTVQAKFSSIELHDRLPVLFQFGVSASLPVGTDVAVVFVGGDRSNGVIVASNNKAVRPKNRLPGECEIYDAFGKSIRLSQDGGIIVEANGAPVTVNQATTVTINASDEIDLVAPKVNVRAP